MRFSAEYVFAILVQIIEYRTRVRNFNAALLASWDWGSGTGGQAHSLMPPARRIPEDEFRGIQKSLVRFCGAPEDAIFDYLLDIEISRMELIDEAGLPWQCEPS
jgi:hypothetical protein